MTRRLIIIIVGFACVIASLSCRNVAQVAGTEGVSTPQSAATKLHLPQSWLDEIEGVYSVQQIEVRKVPNAPDEFFFGALPDGDNFYAHEVDKNLRKPRYGKNMFAVNFSAGARARVATQQEWESGSRIATQPRLVIHNRPDPSSGEIEYRQKRYPKVGKYWGEGLLSPTGRWLAVFSYTGEQTPPSFFFGGGEVPFGDAFFQIYDTATGRKVFEWEAKGVKHPTHFTSPVVWLEDRYFIFPEDKAVQNFIVVTLPPVTPEVNPMMVQFPSRRDAAGRWLPAGDRHEVWIPLVPLTKEQAAKLTAPYATEISEVRVSRPPAAAELLFALKEETENRRVDRSQQRDGAGEYHFKVVNTYYYAVSLDNQGQTRVATKEEWDRSKTLRHARSTNPPTLAADKVKLTDWPYRQLPKTGTTWGSPPLLTAGDWIAVFSYTQGNLFIDIYDRLLGDKLLSTALPFKSSPNESFKNALAIEGGYILMPLNASLDSFALWQLP